MAKYLLMNDIHLSDQHPASCTPSYNDDIFDVLDASVVFAHELNAAHARYGDLAAVIWAGDIFHHKTPSRTSHRTMRRVIEVAGSYPCPLWIVPGNHDLSHDRLASIDEGQPLGVLVASGMAKLLTGWMDSFHPVFGVPWIRDLTPDTLAAAVQGWELVDGPKLMVTHAPLYPPGRELPYEFYSTHDWAAALGHKGNVHYGHVHEPHGVYCTDGVWFCNPGAISRGSLHEHNLTRDIRCALWDSDSGAFTTHVLPAKPAAEVFRIEEVVEEKAKKVELDDFLAAVGETQLSTVSIGSLVEHLRTLKLGDAFDKLATKLLEGLDA